MSYFIAVVIRNTRVDACKIKLNGDFRGLRTQREHLISRPHCGRRNVLMISQVGLPDDTATLYRLQVRGIRDYAMFLTDVRGTILTWNKGVEELLGYSEEEFIGKDASIIFTPEDRAADVPATEMQRACEEGQAANIRWHQRKDGTQLYTHGTLQALRTEEGALIGYAKVISDETRQKRLEDALTQSNASLSQFSHALRMTCRSRHAQYVPTQSCSSVAARRSSQESRRKYSFIFSRAPPACSSLFRTCSRGLTSPRKTNPGARCL